MFEWQPIETAPKDGREILLYAEIGLRTGIYVGYYDASQSEYVGPFGAFVWRGAPVDSDSSAVAEQLVTHWMPLPRAPR